MDTTAARIAMQRLHKSNKQNTASKLAGITGMAKVGPQTLLDKYRQRVKNADSSVASDKCGNK